MSPNCVKIVEVGPRDGLQNIQQPIPTATKIDLIKRLSRTGLRNIEATSFVSPKWVPQLSDARDVMQDINSMSASETISYPVLVPNMKGLDAAIAAGVKEIGVFLSATEAFSYKNINCSVDESLVRAQAVVEKALALGIRVRAYVSCIVDCPYSGLAPTTNVLSLSKRLLQMGCYEISLGDTTGAAKPHQIRKLLSTLTKEIPASKLAGHFHDTYENALANVIAAYEMGIRTFDSSVSGLGGCPYSPGAKGNVATEDLVYLFNSIGVETGVDLGQVLQCGQWISGYLGQENGSHVAAALVARQMLKRDVEFGLQSCSREELRILRDVGFKMERRGQVVLPLGVD